MSYTPYPLNKEINTDAGGRTRVSTLTTLFDGKTLNSDDALSWETVGTGSSALSGNKVTLSVTVGQYRIRRSRRYLPYYSGKSQIIETTFDGFDSVTGLVERVGYFSSDGTGDYSTTLDGFFLENTAGVIFNLKNNYSWKDQQDVNLGGQDDNPIEISVKHKLLSNLTEEQLEALNED